MRNRVLAGLAFFFVLGTALVLALIQRVNQWPETVPPLTLHEIGQLHSDGDAMTRVASPSTARENPEPPETPSGLPILQFVAMPSDDQLRQRFCGDGCWENVAVAARRRSFRVAGATALYDVVPIARIRLVPANVAGMYLASGEFDKARPYLREAVRVRYVETLRLDLCAQLAWLEDDPAVAAALIEESLSSIPDANSTGAAYAALNALELAVVTGSDAMADRYFQRYRDRWPAFIESRGAEFPNATAWLANRGVEARQS